MKEFLKSYDYIILLCVFFLLGVSLVGIYSATVDSPNFFKKQLVFVGLSVFIILVFPFIPYRKILNLSPFLYILGIVSLVLVHFFGVVVLGAKRWLSFGFFNLQPSEFMKFIVIVYVSYLLANAKIPITWKDVLKVLVVVAIPFALVFKQPDFGTALTILFPVLFILFMAQLDKKYIIGSLAALIIASPFIWRGIKDYQKQRILALFNPTSESAYQLNQSKIAIGSGGLYGKGFLKGTQSKLLFLPEKHTDFIFATLSEEWGFFLSASIIVVYLILTLRILYWGVRVRDKAGKFVCFGVSGLIGSQAFINIAMTVGLAPVVGITLPFISYGGSSLISFSLMIGLVLSVIREEKKEKLRF